LIALYINNEGYYVLLSNIYALANKWENFVMMEEGVEKSPGNHLNEIDGKNHNFIVGEWRPRPEVVETERKIRLPGHIRNTADTLFDIDEEERECS